MNDKENLNAPQEVFTQASPEADTDGKNVVDESVEEKENIISVWKGSGEDKPFRRRWFEGYTQYETLDSDGKRRLHHVYTGMWYTQKLTKKERNIHRFLYAAAAVLGFALMLFGGTRTIPINVNAFGALFPFAGMFTFGWMMVAVFNEFTLPQRRTIGEYRASSQALKRSGLTTALCGAVSCLITLVFILVDRDKIGLHFLAAAAELAAGALGFGVRHFESKVIYEEKMSKDAGKYNM